MVKDLKLLNKALSLGIIDLDLVRCEVLMKEHKFKIWQGSNGFYYTYILKGGERKLVKKKRREDLLRAIEDGKARTIEEAFNEWIEKKMLWGELDDSTVIKYKNDFKRFFSGSELIFLGLDELSDYAVEDFIKTTIKEKNLSSKGYQNLKIILTGSLKYAKKKGLTTYSIGNFFRDFEVSERAFKKKREKEIIFSKADRESLIRYLRAHETIENLAILLLSLTGLRIGELSALKKIDNIEEGKLYIRRTEVKILLPNGKTTKSTKEEGKGGKSSVIFIPPEAQDTIDKAYELTKGQEFLFSKDGRRLSSWVLSEALRKACKGAGIPYHSPHKMRKTYASLLLSEGVPEPIVKEQMRHNDISTTRSYYYFDVGNPLETERVITKVISVT